MTKILCIDDSLVIRKLLTSDLEQEGYDVVTGVDGIDGLRVLDENPNVSVIITDINMPALDGFGVIKEVRAKEAFRTVPIIVLTTESNSEKKKEARDAGATGWIVKPFTSMSLVSAIRRVGA